MTYEAKMYHQIQKADELGAKDHRKYQAYGLAAVYAAKAESITNKHELIEELIAKRETAYTAYV